MGTLSVVDPTGGQLLAVLAAAAVGGVVQGAVGFGAGVLVAAVAAQWLAPEATVVAAQAAVAAGAATTLRLEREATSRPHLRPLGVGALAGLPLGVLALAVVPREGLRAALAALLLAAAVEALRPGGAARRRPAASRADAPAGVLTGASAAAVGTGGPVIGGWLAARGMVGAPLRATTAAVTLPLALLAAAAAAIAAAPDPALLLTAPAAALGIVAGRGPVRRLHPPALRRTCGVAVLAAAVALVA